MVCFCFNVTATKEIYTLSLHDALPILHQDREERKAENRLGQNLAVQIGTSKKGQAVSDRNRRDVHGGDRKSTRLNSSHVEISYAVFCLKKKKEDTAASYPQPVLTASLN